jgi:hypothetical protein
MIFVIITLMTMVHSGSSYRTSNDCHPGKTFDVSTVQNNPWPWLSRELPKMNNLCQTAAKKEHSGRVLACERLERFFFALELSDLARTRPDIQRAINIVSSSVSYRLILRDEPISSKDTVTEILEEFFALDGGLLWRRGLVSPETQYELAFSVLKKVDEIQERY